MDTGTVYRRRWWTLGVLWLSLLLIGLDATILNVALPALTRGLGASTSELQWIVDAYVLSFAGLLLTAGNLGDRFGRKRILAVGLAIFGVASAAAAYADSPAVLIFARTFMGVGAAIIMPLTLSILPHVFGPEERSRALAIWTAGSGLGLTLGPVIGGLLLERFWWGSVFLVNVPVVVAALAAGSFLIPESKAPGKPRIDPVGVLLSSSGLASLVYGIIEAPRVGWAEASTFVLLVAGALLVAAFIAWEMRALHPMLDLTLFRNRRFTWASMVLALASFALFGMLFFVPQYLQFVLGATGLGTGVRLVPMVAAMAVGAPLSGWLVERFGTKLVIGSGLMFVFAGLVMLSRTQVETDYGFVASCLGLLGFGLGTAMAPAIDEVIGALPQARTGIGSGLNNTMRQVGGALGVAILGSLLATAYNSGMINATQGLSTRDAEAAQESIGAATEIASSIGGEVGRTLLGAARVAFIGGMDRAALLAAGVTLIGAIIAFVFLPSQEEEGSRRMTIKMDEQKEGTRL